jgi:hypothetical protein
MMQLHEPSSARCSKALAAPKRFRLWLPLTPLLILLSPLLLLAIVIVIEGVRTLLALHGTRVEVQSPDASILINIF